MPAKAINLLPERTFEKTIVGRILRWSLTYGRYIIISTEIIVLAALKKQSLNLDNVLNMAYVIDAEMHIYHIMLICLNYVKIVLMEISRDIPINKKFFFDIRTVLSYNGYYKGFWLPETRFDSVHDPLFNFLHSCVYKVTCL